MSSHEHHAGPGTGGSGVEIPHGDPLALSGHMHSDSVHLPRPTAWPIVTAFGFTLVVAGILTHYVMSIMGAVLLIRGCVGWFREVLPHELHENIPVKIQEVHVASARKSVARISVSPEHRKVAGAHTFSIGAGLKGGILGGIAMVIPALAYGAIAQHSIWYTVNLLGGAGVAAWTNPTPMDLRTFHAEAFGIALVIHALSCLMIGVVYGCVLPIIARAPIVVGGILAPLCWSGLLYITLPIINPELNQLINWGAFLISQFVFGIVAGWIVSRDEHYRISKQLPIAMRLGLEAGGMGHHANEEQK